MIRYVKGDIFHAVPAKVDNHPWIMIPHVVNDAGQWGAGFTGALSKRYPEVEHDYRRWMSGGATPSPEHQPTLGNILFSGVEADRVIVAHMVAQVRPRSRRVPLDRTALARCLGKVARAVRNIEGCEIHCPLFGCGLAGGRWFDDIEPRVQGYWRGILVTVYYLETIDGMP